MPTISVVSLHFGIFSGISRIFLLLYDISLFLLLLLSPALLHALRVKNRKCEKAQLNCCYFHLLLLTAATKNSNANVHNNKTNEIASIAFSKSVTPQPWNFCEAIVRVIHDPRVRRCFLIVERSGVPTPKS